MLWPIGVWIGAAKAVHQVNRWWYYRRAERKAQTYGKPFLVVGNPYGRHGCGDLLIDAKPLGQCPVEMRAYVQRMPMFTDQQFGAVFVGHVLEHLSLTEAKAALLELKRITHYLVILYPVWWDILPKSRLYSLRGYPGHKSETVEWLWSMDPDGVLEWEE